MSLTKVYIVFEWTDFPYNTQREFVKAFSSLKTAQKYVKNKGYQRKTHIVEVPVH